MANLAVVYAGDEAGNISFNFNKGATRYFVVALIGTQSPDELRAGLGTFRLQHSLGAQYEFSFYELSGLALLNNVLTHVSGLDFQAWALVVDKSLLPDSFRIMHRLEFYMFFVSELLRLIPEEERQGSTLILDEYDRSGKTINALRRTMRLRSLAGRFKTIVTRRSLSESLSRSLTWWLDRCCAKLLMTRVGLIKYWAKICRLLYEYRP